MQWALLFQHFAKVDALDVLHREEVHVADLAGVVGIHDVVDGPVGRRP